MASQTLPQNEYDQLRRLQDQVKIAEGRYEIAVMRAFAENRVDPRTARLIVTDTGASFVKHGEAAVTKTEKSAAASENGTATTATANAAAGVAGAPKRGRGRPRKNPLPDEVETDDNSHVIASTADLEPGVIHDVGASEEKTDAASVEGPAPTAYPAPVAEPTAEAAPTAAG